MVDWKVRNNWKFQVWEKSGSENTIFAVRLGFWNFWMIQKSKKIVLLQITQNGPIRENKWLEPKSGTFFWMSLNLHWLQPSSHFLTIFPIFFAPNHSE